MKFKNKLQSEVLKMKKYGKWILILIGIIVLIGIICYLFFSQPPKINNNGSNASKISTEIQDGQIGNNQSDNNIIRKRNNFSY